MSIGPMVGFTDGAGNVAGLPEDDEQDTFLQTVGDVVSQQYEITPEGGGNYVPPSEPAYDPWSDEQNYTPPASGSDFFNQVEPYAGDITQQPWTPPAAPPPTPGSSFFSEGFTEGAPGDSFWQPTTTYVTNDEYFGGLVDNLGLPTLDAPAAPVPGAAVGMDGTGWFGDESAQQQQIRWWESEVDRAIRNNDKAKYDALMAERDRAAEGWTIYDQQWGEFNDSYGILEQRWSQYEDQIGALNRSVEQAFAFDPRGEGGFARQAIEGQGPRGGGTSSFLIPNEVIRANFDAAGFTQQQVDQYLGTLNQPQYAADLAAIDAESAYLGQWQGMSQAERELAAAFETWQNSPLSDPGYSLNRWGRDPDYQAEQAKFNPALYGTGNEHERFWGAVSGVTGTIGSGLDLAWNGAPGPLPSLRDVTTTVAGAGWSGAKWVGNRGVPGTDRSVADTAFAALDTPVRTVEMLAYSAISSTGEVLRGENAKITSFSDFQRELSRKNENFEQWRERNWSWLLLPEMVADPLNLVTGAGLVKPFRAANTAGKARVVGRTFGQLVSEGVVSADEIARLADMKPSWATILNLHAAPQRLASEMKIVVAAGKDRRYFDDFSKRLALSLTVGAEYGSDPITIYRTEIRKMTERIAAESGNTAARRFEERMARVNVPQFLQTADEVTTIQPTPAMVNSQKVGDLGTEAGPAPSQVSIPATTVTTAPTEAVMDRGTWSLAEVFADEPLPPLTAPLTQPLDASGSQLRLLDLLGRRDGVNYVDVIAQGGDLSSSAVTRTITEANARGLATIGQLDELMRIGRPWDEIRHVARQSRQQAQQHLDQVKGQRPIHDVDASGFLTEADFRQQYPGRIGPLRATQGDGDFRVTSAQVALAAERGQTYGVDLLRALANDPRMSRRAFGQLINTRNLPASPAQLRYVRGLVDRGSLDARKVNLDRLTAAQADRLIKRGDAIEVETVMKYDLALPDETGRSADIARVDDVLLRRRHRSAVTRFLKQHLPDAAGQAERGAELGIPVMLPEVLQQVLAANRAAFRGTRFENAVDELGALLLRGGDSTTSAAWNHALRGLLDDVAQASDDETAILWRVIHDGNYQDTVAESRQAARVAEAEANPTRAADPAAENRRAKRTRLERELREVKKQKNLALMGQGNADVDLLRARQTKIEGQLDALNRASHNDVQTEPTVRSARRERQERTAQRVQEAVPTIGPRPGHDAAPTLAGQASSHDIAGLILDQPAMRETPARVAYEPASPEHTLRSWVDAVSRGGGLPSMIPLHVRRAAQAAGLTVSDDPMALIRQAVDTYGITPTGRVSHEGMARLGLVTGADALVALTGKIKAGTWRRPVAPVIDFTADAWARVDWATVAPRFDAYVDRYYSFDDLLDDERRVRIFGKRLNPTALTNASRVAKVGDLVAADLMRFMDEAYASDRPYQFIRDTIRQRMESAFSDTVRDLDNVDQFYAHSKHGREVMRVWRKYGDYIISRFEAATPHSSIGDLIEDGILPASKNGKYTGRELMKLDDILNRRTTPRLPAAAVHQLANFRAAYREKWNTHIKKTFYDEATGTWTGEVDILEQLDPVFFPDEAGDVVDLPKLAEKIGSMVSHKYADDIGFNWTTVPPMLRLMQWIKGNLTPLWMTLWPGYHLNNISGNYMAQLLGSVRSDMGLNALPVRDGNWMIAVERSGSGVTRHPILASPFMKEQTQVTEGLAQRDPDDYLVPKMLKKTPLAGRYYEGMVNLASKSELRAREIVYSQQWGYTFTRTWRHDLDDLVTEGRLTREDADALVGVIGVDLVAQTARGRGLDGMVDPLLALHRKGIAEANVKAYRSTAEVLRDYTMRNKFDGFLDRFLPVHYWTTKNMAFVTRTALDRPAVAVAAGTGYDAWQQENEHLPPTLRTGYLPISIPDGIPGIGGREWHMRLTNITNPALFAIPRMVDPDRWNAYSDMSIKDRLLAWSKDGMTNFWSASGYRIGPQWDYAIKASNLATQMGPFKDNAALQRLVDGANFIASPHGYRSSWLPLGGFEVQANRSQHVQRAIEWMNSTVYGSAYTRNEISKFGYAIVEQLQLGHISDEAAREALRKLHQQEYDDPVIRTIIDNVMGNSANVYLVGRAGMLSGTEYTDSWRMGYEANRRYWQIAEEQGREIADREMYGQMPVALRWLIDERNAGRISQQQLDRALEDGRAGKDNPLLKRAWDATNTVEAVIRGDVTFWTEMMQLQARYDAIAEDKGIEEANRWAFGTYNRQTGKSEDAHAPWLATYWIANDQGEKALAALDRADQRTVRQDAQARRDEYYATLNEKINAAAPYYARGEKVDETLRVALIRAGDNLFLQDQAYREHSKGWAVIREDAATAGVELVGSGLYPSEGEGHYSRTLAERNFLEWNDALEAVEGRERDQRRRGFVLDIVADELGVKKYIEVMVPTTDPSGEARTILVENPDYWTEGPDGKLTFDEREYERDLKAAAKQAPMLYSEVIRQLRAEGYEIPAGGGITADDFLYHTREKHPELDAWREQRNTDRQAWFDMEPGPEKDARADELRRLYGGDFLNFEERQAVVSGNEFTTRDNYIYGATADVLGDHYQTLRPSEKRALQAEFPDAFEPTVGVNDDGREYEYERFIPTNLTTEQLLTLKDRYGLTIGERQSDREMATDDRRTVGVLERQSNDQRIATNSAGSEAYSQWVERSFMTEEQRQIETERFNYLDEQGGKPIIFEGQEMTFEEAANLVYNSDAALTKKGYRSWGNAARSVGEDSELGQYILGRKALGDAVNNAGVYSVKDNWWKGLPKHVRGYLLDEYPDTFERYATATTEGETTDAVPSESAAIPEAHRGSGTVPGSGSGYTERRGTYTPYRPYDRGGSFNPSGSGSGSGSPEPATLYRGVFGLDPILAAGAGADFEARSEAATRVADHITRLVGTITMVGGLEMGQRMQALWLTYISRMLGPDPDLAAWQRLIARLFRPRPAQQAGTIHPTGRNNRQEQPVNEPERVVDQLGTY